MGSFRLKHSLLEICGVCRWPPPSEPPPSSRLISDELCMEAVEPLPRARLMAPLICWSSCTHV
eukprot:scaffold649363_cov43-Prasinocladus_malaysianus.AAC.1